VTRKGQHGNAILEFALSIAVLVPLTVTCFQHLGAWAMWGEMEEALTRAARYASTLPYDSASPSPSNSFRTAVANMAVFGKPDGGDSPALAGLRPEHVSVTLEFRDGRPAFVVLGVAGFQVDGLIGVIDFSGRTQVSYPYVGRWSPAQEN
jgi:hypothetical protein